MSDVVFTRAGASTVARPARVVAFRRRLARTKDMVAALASSVPVKRGRALSLPIAQAACLSGAGFTVNLTVGLVVSALSLGYIEWRRDHV